MKVMPNTIPHFSSDGKDIYNQAIFIRSHGDHVNPNLNFLQQKAETASAKRHMPTIRR